ncbi:MAG: signal peptidase I [Clostridia bacterium]|nr:signal peptidase I [Clostridia bacterium]
MKAIRIVLRIILIAVISLTVGLTVYTRNARRVFHDAMPMPFGIGISVVMTGSMEPTLKINDIVIIKKADSYQVDDIVVFQQGSDLIIHRIIEMTEVGGEETTQLMVRTQGDANPVDDGLIPVSDLKGIYVFRLPVVGLILKAAKSVPGILAILAGSIFLLLMSWRNEKKQDDKEINDIKAQIAAIKGETVNETPESLEEQIQKLKAELEKNGRK